MSPARALVLGAILGGLLGAVSSNPLIPLVNGRGVVAETNNTYGAGYSTIMAPIIFVSDDTNVNETTGVAIDTGDEACAAIAMDCADVYVIENAGVDDSDDLFPSTCATDLADQKIALAFCY